VICDFEQAAMNSVTSTLGQHVTVQGCVLLEELGLSTVYRDDVLRHYCGMLDALAFLTLTDVVNGISFLRGCVPSGEDSTASSISSTTSMPHAL